MYGRGASRRGRGGAVRGCGLTRPGFVIHAAAAHMTRGHNHANIRPRNPYFMPPPPCGPPFGYTPGGPRLGHGDPWGPPRFQGRPPLSTGQDLAENGGKQNQGRGYGRGGRGMKRRPSGQQPHPNKKRKMDSKESEVNYYCDTCDRGFKVEEKYHEHCNTHIHCPKEGCSYVAAQKLVNIHIKTQHRSGHAKKIWQIESEEDIKKWIAERKRNFPTKENIARKKDQEKQKLERGEVLENKCFGKMRGKRGRRHGHMNRRNMRRHMSGSERPKPFGQNYAEDGNLPNNGLKPSERDDTRTSNWSLRVQNKKQEKHPAVDPLAVLLKSGDSEDEESGEEKELAAGPLQLAGGLGCLASAYGSDMSDSEDQEPSGTATETQCENTPDKSRSTTKCITASKPVSVSSPQEQSRESGGSLQENLKFSDRPSRQTIHRNKMRKSGMMCKKSIDKKLTLLQKLLTPEIRHERNVILQCVRHIVKNNFFDMNNQPNFSVAADSINPEQQSVNCNTSHSQGVMYVEESDIWED